MVPPKGSCAPRPCSSGKSIADAGCFFISLAVRVDRKADDTAPADAMQSVWTASVVCGR